jgi:tetratricopeptide (TPR) repeat protein
VPVEKVPQLMLVAVQCSGYKQARVLDAAVHHYIGRPAARDGTPFPRGVAVLLLPPRLRLEDQVPEDHLLRLIDRHVSFEFIRAKLKDSYSDAGRPSIDYSYVTGELDKSIQAYELWQQSYPRDFLPVGNRGDNHMTLGEWEKALQETQESLRLELNNGMAHSNLAWIQLALDRREDSKTTLEQARARKLDSYFLRLATYEIASLQGDQNTMQQQLAWAAGRVGEEDWLLSAQSDTEAYFGRL